MTKMRVNKIEAARRQIDAAIRMLFNNEDPVPIHTVAAAAFRILCDLANGNDTQRWKQFEHMINPELKGEFWQRMNRPANFFKHADVDEEYNDATIFLTIVIYQDLGYQLTVEMRTFFAWFAMGKPHFFQHDEHLTPLLRQGKQFFEQMKWSRVERLSYGRWLLGQQKSGTIG